MKRFRGIMLLCALSACAPEAVHPGDAAACQRKGITPASAGYEACLSREKSARLLEEQRREFEQLQQKREDDKARRF